MLRIRRQGTSVTPRRHGHLGLVCAVVGLASALAAEPASARVALVDDAAPRFEWGGHVETDFHHQFETRTDRGDEFDHWRLGLAGEFGGPINESILVGLRAGYAHESWDINLDNGVPANFGGTGLPREPWNTINSFDLVPSASVLVGSRVTVVAGVPIRWAGESGADRNGFAAGVSALVRWAVNDDFSIGAGIGVTSELEDSARSYPLVSLHWRIDESLSLHTEGSWLQGGQAVLLWGPSESIRLRFSAGYERTRFRLDDNGSAADRNGIGEVSQVPIELGLRLAIGERRPVLLDLHAGLAFAGRLRVETDDGRKLYDQAFDPAPRVGFRIRVPFGVPARGAAATDAARSRATR